MNNYDKSDGQFDVANYLVAVHSNSITCRNTGNWIPFWSRLTNSKKWNGQHQLLPTTDSPTISTCTTATNLSSLDIRQPFGSIVLNSNRRMGTLEENLRVAQPEIEPLQTKDKDLIPPPNGSVNASSCSINVYNDTTRPKPQFFRQIVTALSVSLVSLVVGFVSAYTSPAADSMKKELGVNDDEYSWVCGLMPLGALLGGLTGGTLIEVLGRKRTILLTDVLFIVSWITLGTASDIWHLYAGRSIAGFSVGIASLALPVYLGETIQPEVRGTLGLLPTAFGNVGILVCFIAGTYLPWNTLALLGILFPLPYLALTFLIPETPRWYMSKNRPECARNSLQWLRGKDADVSEEFQSMVSAQRVDEKGSSSNITDLFTKPNLKPLLISLGLMFFQQMSGINAVIFYTTEIFDMAGSTIDKNLCTIIVGVVNFVSTFIATLLIDRLGRKVLLYVSSISMVVTLGSLGSYFYLRSIGVPVLEYGWVPLASFMVYVLGFSLGFGPIPWLMLGEILPSSVRGSSASVAAGFNWSCTFIVTKTFVNIIHYIGAHGTFWLFAVVCFVSILFVILWVPETQGQTLQDIERKLAGIKVRRMSSVANMKPLPSTF